MSVGVKLAIVTLLAVSYYEAAEGQITTPCSSAAISSFTPCMNYITGSSANGGSPSGDCCDAVRSIMSGSVECACLIINGNVPFSIPFISRPLAISLPQACNSGIPLRCKGPIIFGAPPSAPAPVANSPKNQAGPIIFGAPTLAPAPAANSPKNQADSKAAAAVAAPSPTEESPNQITPAASPAPALSPTEADPGPAPTEAPTKAVSSDPVANPADTTPVTNPRIRPVVTPNSGSTPSYIRPPVLTLTLLGLMVLIRN
ncbi:OLC1v1007247C1 [Oldenlandia corymbosa var. corymbosa]|uniref:OLC1v1007247C1 n=1 Tax=Oldenlandia corymbosa var. corymbosa TaxID=529605 RepID=A0AAV1DIW0_OLDCO|nr:OLC1v1007247C1 [Oldenlandia corymbosa var. corymbosa]